METLKIENQTKSIEIASTIIDQIRYADKFALMAWGGREFVALPESEEFQGGLRFRVNGLKHKGYVVVQLRWVDDYTVSFLNKKGHLVHKSEGVYCDMLVLIIDWIEGK